MGPLTAVVVRAASAKTHFRIPRASARRVVSLLLIVAWLATEGCVFRSMKVASVDRPATRSWRVASPIKAHLFDGRTVVFREGGTITPDSLMGYGEVFDLRLKYLGVREAIPLDSILGMETFRTSVNGPATVLGTTLALAGITLGGSALAVAIFGSCPTFYVDSAGTPVLQAEGFSYSIAPLFEARDVDLLRGGAVDGRLSIEVRNEALETHYINHLELVEARHAANEHVLPDPKGQPLAVSDLRAPVAIRDADGRDLAALLSEADGSVFASSVDRLRLAARAGATGAELRDHIDLELPAPAGADSVAVVLRLRNSLLATTLLYDVMLKGQGAGSLDWIGQELERIGPAVELGRWYTETMGLRVMVDDGTGFVESATLFDTGPIAFKEVAVLVPVPDAEVLRVRLDFVTDNWRIDRVAIAGRVRRPAVRYLDLDDVVTAEGASHRAALELLRAPDEDYLLTQPGQRFDAVFQVGADPTTGARTFLIAAQGYYIEWVRGAWLTEAETPREFVPSEATLKSTLRRWLEVKDDLEARFHDSRIPVR